MASRPVSISAFGVVDSRVQFRPLAKHQPDSQSDENARQPVNDHHRSPASTIELPNFTRKCHLDQQPIEPPQFALREFAAGLESLGIAKSFAWQVQLRECGFVKQITSIEQAVEPHKERLWLDNGTGLRRPDIGKLS